MMCGCGDVGMWVRGRVWDEDRFLPLLPPLTHRNQKPPGKSGMSPAL